jgi:pimeloyl-ACP methyl ester carboxylesterase
VPAAWINGRNLGYEEHGPADGPVVILVAGTGAPGRVWRPNQVPALRRAGHRVITFDNRGLDPRPGPPPARPRGPAAARPAAALTLDDLVRDLTGLIEHLGAAPCALVGHSLGGIVVQETVLARPDLVDRAVLVAAGGRTDTLVAAATAADLALADSGVRLPPAVAAHRHALQNLSPRTLDDDARLADWLGLLELTLPDPAAARAQLALGLIPDRLAAYRRITRPCLAVAFADDLVVRPRLTRELAAAIPGCGYVEIPGCGHLGYLERPEEVNAVLLRHLAPRIRCRETSRSGPPPS